jgi:hypothetical protein
MWCQRLIKSPLRLYWRCQSTTIDLTPKEADFVQRQSKIMVKHQHATLVLPDPSDSIELIKRYFPSFEMPKKMKHRFSPLIMPNLVELERVCDALLWAGVGDVQVRPICLLWKPRTIPNMLLLSDLASVPLIDLIGHLRKPAGLDFSHKYIQHCSAALRQLCFHEEAAQVENLTIDGEESIIQLIYRVRKPVRQTMTRPATKSSLPDAIGMFCLI